MWYYQEQQYIFSKHLAPQGSIKSMFFSQGKDKRIHTIKKYNLAGKYQFSSYKVKKRSEERGVGRECWCDVCSSLHAAGHVC